MELPASEDKTRVPPSDGGMQDSAVIAIALLRLVDCHDLVRESELVNLVAQLARKG